MRRRRRRRPISRSGSKSTAGRLKRRKAPGSNLLLDLSIGVTALVLVVLLYSWAQHQFLSAPAPDTALLSLDQKPTLVTRRMWLEKAYKDIEVEVLNGCGVDGAAQTLTEYLREIGFDVVNSANADNFDYPRTLILDRRGHHEKAVKVAMKLGIDTTLVAQSLNDDLMLDVTVILGGDFASLHAFQSIALQEPE